MIVKTYLESVYLHSCSDLIHMKAISSAFCAEVLTSSRHASMAASSHYCIFSRMCAILDKATTIHEILNVWMTNRLVSEVWPVGEHLIHNL
jgi:hypothetical protein